MTKRDPKTKNELKVFISSRDSKCDECGEELDETAVRLAVAAHVRHVEMNYDNLLVRCIERSKARRRVQAGVDDVLAAWEFGPGSAGRDNG